MPLPRNPHTGTVNKRTYYDNETGTKCSQWFVFRPQHWEVLEAILGQEVIPIVKGWSRDRCNAGNPLLEATDKVETVGTPFERNEYYANQRYWGTSRWREYYFRNTNGPTNWLNKKPPESAKIADEPGNAIFDFYLATGFRNKTQ